MTSVRYVFSASFIGIRSSWLARSLYFEMSSKTLRKFSVKFINKSFLVSSTFACAISVRKKIKKISLLVIYKWISDSHSYWIGSRLDWINRQWRQCRKTVYLIYNFFSQTFNNNNNLLSINTKISSLSKMMKNLQKKTQSGTQFSMNIQWTTERKNAPNCVWQTNDSK